MQSLGGALQQSQQATPTLQQNSFNGLPYEANDSTQYTFDPASFNFGNHYGALEFGMLAHMSSGAAATPSSDAAVHQNHGNGANYATPGAMSTGYSGSPNAGQSYRFSQDQSLNEWRAEPQTNASQGPSTAPYALAQGRDSVETLKQEAPPAFTIGAIPSAFASPDGGSSSQDVVAGFDNGSSGAATYMDNVGRQVSQDRTAHQRQPQIPIATPRLQASALPSRRPRNPSSIYENVKQPYSYTTGFHGLTEFIAKRFSGSKRIRIAKAMAAIRPSFISCAKSLSREDLIFMEKCFQRTLWEYEEFINACGTPTIVCRRTGEVAAVGKEFTILTGWTKEVLLGKEPNMNINGGATSGPPGTGASSRGGVNTPRVIDSTRPQPVFLAELLDDDSFIQFYEDFAKLAFGDSRGSVTTQCKLLKYKTMEDPTFGMQGEPVFDDEVDTRLRINPTLGWSNNGSDARIDDLGKRDGKIECSYCWTVKRDVFEVPMMIVMNVSAPHIACSTGWLMDFKFLPCIR